MPGAYIEFVERKPLPQFVGVEVGERRGMRQLVVLHDGVPGVTDDVHG